MNALGTKTNEFVYITINSSEFAFTVADFAGVDGTEPWLEAGNVAWVNGNDAARIVRKSDDAIIDFYGVEGENGDGKP
ncbi:hypothetical protein [Flavicella sediminum]|uniref:hypothetical protein n=1 Tax=Flavicella sediminum TaxID=2585141 RepID=UPI00112183EB|nr:hypothetical protein [Flavicella sediminum]